VAVVAAAVAVQASVVVAVVVAVVAAVAVLLAVELAEVALASVNTLARRKAKRLRKHQRESLYPH
jgi:hypothetical protein